MPKLSVPVAFGDVSDLARSLRAQLGVGSSPPSHLDLLNMLARAAGYRNHQNLRADAAARLEVPPADATPCDIRLVERVARQFDGFGQLVRLPARTSHQALALWPFWADLPPGRDLSEAEVNGVLRDRHLFSDHATLRRMMVSTGLLARTDDGRVHRRVERAPTPEAALLIKLVSRKPGADMVAQVESFLRRQRRDEAAAAKGQAPSVFRSP
ncbi:DUF2087 domain-containing protein [uncultured Sphingomonas sp.]|uniref:DUF2087 domain-containing protein n=1 Tax=uncultured Sphingomonas sp. TaxID=158754 RepID=UPI0035CB2714